MVLICKVFIPREIYLHSIIWTWETQNHSGLPQSFWKLCLIHGGWIHIRAQGCLTLQYMLIHTYLQENANNCSCLYKFANFSRNFNLISSNILPWMSKFITCTREYSLPSLHWKCVPQICHLSSNGALNFQYWCNLIASLAHWVAHLWPACMIKHCPNTYPTWP